MTNEVEISQPGPMTRWVKCFRDLNYEERLEVQSLENKKDRKRFGPDSQDHKQPNCFRSNPTVQVLQEARTKKVII